MHNTTLVFAAAARLAKLDAYFMQWLIELTYPLPKTQQP